MKKYFESIILDNMPSYMAAILSNNTRALFRCWAGMILLVMTGHYETFSWLDGFFEL